MSCTPNAVYIRVENQENACIDQSSRGHLDTHTVTIGRQLLHDAIYKLYTVGHEFLATQTIQYWSPKICSKSDTFLYTVYSNTGLLFCCK